MTIDPRIPTMQGRTTSGFYRPGRHCLRQARSETRGAGRVARRVSWTLLRTAFDVVEGGIISYFIGVICVTTRPALASPPLTFPTIPLPLLNTDTLAVSPTVAAPTASSGKAIRCLLLPLLSRPPISLSRPFSLPLPNSVSAYVAVSVTRYRYRDRYRRRYRYRYRYRQRYRHRYRYRFRYPLHLRCLFRNRTARLGLSLQISLPSTSIPAVAIPRRVTPIVQTTVDTYLFHLPLPSRPPLPT